MKNYWSVWVLAGSLSGVVLTGCSLPLKSQLPAEQVYRLSPEIKPANGTATGKINLYLPSIEVNPALDNRNIMLAMAGNRLDFIADSRWPDKLSDYLQAVLINGLATTGQFQSVSKRMLGRENNYRLLLRVNDFQAEFADDPATRIIEQAATTVTVNIEAFLVRIKDQRLSGHYRYEVNKRDVPVKTSHIVAAFEQALSEILADMTADLIEVESKTR